MAFRDAALHPLPPRPRRLVPAARHLARPLSLLIQCWKMSSQISLERFYFFFFFLAGGSRSRRCTTDCTAVSSDARPFVCACACTCACPARPCLESHKCHQSCQPICIASRNRGHAVLIYEPTNPHCATLGGFLRFFKIIPRDMFT